MESWQWTLLTSASRSTSYQKIGYVHGKPFSLRNVRGFFIKNLSTTVLEGFSEKCLIKWIVIIINKVQIIFFICFVDHYFSRIIPYNSFCQYFFLLLTVKSTINERQYQLKLMVSLFEIDDYLVRTFLSKFVQTDIRLLLLYENTSNEYYNKTNICTRFSCFVNQLDCWIQV